MVRRGASSFDTQTRRFSLSNHLNTVAGESREGVTPSVESGAILEETTVVDVAATAMAHLGLEVESSRDWDGSAVGLKS